MKYLIDGYNLIFECGLHGKQITGKSVAQARAKLLHSIAKRLPDEHQPAVTVVFDASRKMIREELREEYVGAIRVLYAIDFAEADDLIEQLIIQHSVPSQLVVVSSDHRIHKAALRRKATPIDSGQWYDALVAGQLSEPPHKSSVDEPPAREKPDVEILSREELEQIKSELGDLEGR